jgi:ArsR family transcriptional regulator, virulence genes transcriptional regulator
LEESERTAIYKLHADFCKILADASRLLIIMELSHGETSVNELSRKLGLQQSNVSKHLGLMRDHGLVNSRREGATIYCSISDTRIFEAIKLLKDVQTDQIEKRSLLAKQNY